MIKLRYNCFFVDFIGQLKPNVIEYIILNYLQQSTMKIHNIRCHQKCTFDKNTIWDVLKKQLITQYIEGLAQDGCNSTFLQKSLFCIFECIIIFFMSCKNISCLFLSLTEKMYIAIRLYFK